MQPPPPRLPLDTHTLSSSPPLSPSLSSLLLFMLFLFPSQEFHHFSSLRKVVDIFSITFSSGFFSRHPQLTAPSLIITITTQTFLPEQSVYPCSPYNKVHACICFFPILSSVRLLSAPLVLFSPPCTNFCISLPLSISLTAHFLIVFCFHILDIRLYLLLTLYFG